jgi:hypothetical protein
MAHRNTFPLRVTLQKTGTLPKLKLVSSHYPEFIKLRPVLSEHDRR